MIDRGSFTGALIAASSWTAGYFATVALGHELSAVSAYAVIVGWWLTAYVSSIFALSISVSIPLFVGYFLLFLVATMSGQSWFYRDVATLTVPAVLGIGSVQAIAVCSPIIFDWFVRRIIRIPSRDR